MHTAAARPVKLSMWSHSTVSTGRVELLVRLSQFHPIPLSIEGLRNTTRSLHAFSLINCFGIRSMESTKKYRVSFKGNQHKPTNIFWGGQKKLAYKHVLIGSLKPCTQATLHHCQAPEPTPGLRRGSLGHANMSIFFELAPLLTGPGTNPKNITGVLRAPEMLKFKQVS